jgi:hypothetical protein
VTIEVGSSTGLPTSLVKVSITRRKTMTHFRLRWARLGGHVHVGVWSGTEREMTHGCNGRLVFRPDEWEDFVELLRQTAGAGPLSAIELLRENALGGATIADAERVAPTHGLEMA